MSKSQEYPVPTPTVYSDTSSILGVVAFIATLALLLRVVLG